MDYTNNRASVLGEVITEPIFDHEMYSEKFYIFTLRTMRKSGIEDDIQVTFSERLIDSSTIHIGDMIEVEGQYRSYNKMDENKRHRLMISVFVGSIHHTDEEKNVNEIYLNGYICKDPVYRVTPLGREICDLILAVNRNYNKSDYIPVIVWGRNAAFASELSIGTNIRIQGRIQSRVYQKRIDDEKVVSKTAYEVSVNRIELAAGDENADKEV